MDDIVTRLRDRSQCWEVDGTFDDSLTDAQMDREAADEIERLRQEVDLKGSRLDDALDEIDRLRREVLELRGVVRAHEGMYTRAAEEIDRLRGWLERTYRMAVGHGPNWKVFDGWEEAINAYEEARRG